MSTDPTPASGATAIRRISTDIVDHRERRDYWLAAIREHYVRVDLEMPDDEPFRGAIRSVELANGVELTEYTATPSTAHRQSRHIAIDTKDDFFFFLPRHGSMQVQQNRRSCTMHPSSSVLLDGAAPFTMIQAEPVEFLVYRLPAKSVQARLNDPQRLVCRTMTTTGGIRGLTRTFLGAMLECAADEPSISEHRGLGDIVLDLLAIALMDSEGDRIKDDTLARTAIYRRALTVIDERMHEPLTTSEIAARVGVSVRYLQKIFRSQGETIGRTLQSRRLEKARCMLVSPRYEKQTISTIAYLHGFRTVAHFSSSFKRMFGRSPYEIRRQSRLAAGRH